MRKLSKRTVFDVLIICLLGLMPLFWLRGQEIILGHDAGLTLSPVSHFTDRLFVWTERLGIGSDQSYALPGFFIHGLEAFWFILTNSLQQAQKITFIFWLVLPGFTMYYFTRSVFPTRRYLPLISSVFFMLNHFLLQGWFVVERTKFSTYAALPLILLFIIKLFEGKLSPLKAGVLSAFVLLLLNGGGSLPLFGSLIVLVILALIYFIFLDFSRSTVKRAIAYLAITGVSTALLSAFWLLPFIYYALTQFSVEVARAGGADGVLGWAKVISANTSFLNLMRLQGIPDWYKNPFHPYSNLFLQNPFLIAASFIFPILAFSSWFLIKNIKEKTILLFFMALSLIGMFFTAGLHPPTGIIYELMVRFIPGFLVFRTPFYKFAPLIWFSFAILIAFAVDELLERSKNWNLPLSLRLQKLGLFLVILIIILYNFPFLDGRFFDYEKGRSTRIKIPNYIFDFQKWANSQDNKNTRSLLLPALRSGNKLETYNWGYFSFSPLTNLLTNEALIQNGPYNIESEDIILSAIYDDLLNNGDTWSKMSASLGIKNFIVRGDYKWDAFGSPTRKPEDYEKVLKNSPLVYLTKIFGKWRIYSLKENIKPLISASSRISYAESESSFLQYLIALPGFDHLSNLYLKDQNDTIHKNSVFFLSKSDSIHLLPNCITCNLVGANVEVNDPFFLPGSRFYRFVTSREKTLWLNSKDLPKKLDFLITISLRRLLEAKKMADTNNKLDFIDQPIRDHYSLIFQLDNLLKSPADFNSKDGNGLLIKIDSYLDYQQNLLNKIFSKATVDEKIINNNYYELLSIRRKINSWAWRTKDEEDKHYIITVDSAGVYNFWLRKNRLELPLGVDPANITFKFSIDGILYEQKPERSENNWLLIKRLDLSKGIHRIDFQLKPPELFDGKTDTPDGKLPSFVTLDNGVYTLKSQGDKNCVVFKTGNLISGATYRVNFKHRKIEGEQELRIIVSPKRERLLPLTKVGDALESTTTWRNFQINQKTDESDKIFLNICTEIFPDANKKNTSIEIKDLTVKNLSSPIFIFEREKKNLIENSAKITFDKINQIKYKISVKNATSPFFLTFSERFSPDWKLYEYSEGKQPILSEIFSPVGFFSVSNLLRKPLPEKNHFISNMYANSWYINKTGDFDLVLDYKPQSLFYLGFFISVVTSLVLLVVVLKKGEN